MKGALLESSKESMKKEIERLTDFTNKNKGVAIGANNIDEFVHSEEKMSEKLVKYIARENACEEAIDLAKKEFSKKKCPLTTYLAVVRQ